MAPILATAAAAALTCCSALVAPPRSVTQRRWSSSIRAETVAADTEEQSKEVLTSAQNEARSERLKFQATKYFFGRVNVYLGPQYKPLTETLEPSLKDDTTAVASVVVAAPFGMVIEESANYRGKIEVIDVVEGSNAELAGVRVGDILRGTTAMALNIVQSSEEDFGFSVGMSEGTRQRAFLKTDNKKFDLVMAALQSNAFKNSGPGEATLVFERRVLEPATASDAEEA
jgi:hypothetical protein